MGIVVIGTVFVDIKGFPESVYIQNGRNVGRIEYVHGGVSRNVVEDIANMEKIANDCIHCEYFCETCGRCSIPDDDVDEVPCRCKGCPDLCKEKGVCMRGEDI